MKFLVKLFFLIFCLCPAVWSVQAQIKGTKTGKVSPQPSPTPQTVLPVYADADSLSIDFKNFTYSDFGEYLKKSFLLKNGFFSSTNTKTKEYRSFQFRKAYYFDVTGDRKTEAIVHLLADSCEACDEKSVFYAFSAVDNKPREVFKIQTGSGENCGLKTVSFKFNEIIMEAFGDCEIKNSVVGKTLKSLKPEVLSRFTFEFDDREFVLKSKETSEFPLNESLNARPQIKFGQ